ncbi:MAG TPA: MFS transporter [Gemmataceae bacterium]|nr:MFS transporter [Gemmataceae bacterium]
MSADSDPNDSAKKQAAAPPDCPLTHREQTRNLLIYTANWALLYLASPVTYVGLLQATLLKRLGYSDAVSNLPASVYLWTTPLPVLVAWYFPQVRLLKRLMVFAFAVVGAMGALAAAAVLWLGPDWVLAALLVAAAVLGCAIGVIGTCLWEVLGRGVSESRRGQALGLAFGVGPVFAVLASLASQVVLGGKVQGFDLPFSLPTLPYPWSFAALFAASVPVMAWAAFQSSWFVVPPPPVEVARRPFVEGVLGGFGRFFGYRLVLIAAVAYVLVYSGHEVLQNISLYTREAIGQEPDRYAGLQLTLRFGFQIVAGFFLGWLLLKPSPKALLLTTAFLSLLGVAWALAVPGVWFLVGFGILGAGELFGVYYPNYILGCSPKSKMPRNMAFTSLVVMPVGFAPLLYGVISDPLGGEDKLLGFRLSFAASLALLLATMALVLVGLPARPRPRRAAGCDPRAGLDVRLRCVRHPFGTRIRADEPDTDRGHLPHSGTLWRALTRRLPPGRAVAAGERPGYTGRRGGGGGRRRPDRLLEAALRLPDRAFVDRLRGGRRDLPRRVGREFLLPRPDVGAARPGLRPRRLRDRAAVPRAGRFR